MKRGFSFVVVFIFCLTVVCALNDTLFDNETEEIIEINNESLETPMEMIPKIVVRVIDLVVDSSRILIDGLIRISAMLAYENDSPVVGEMVSFYSDNEFIGENTTEGSGISSIVFNGSGYGVGNYTISINGTNLNGSSSVILEIVEEGEDGENEPIANETLEEVIENESLDVQVDIISNESLEENSTEIISNVSEENVSLEEEKNFDLMDVLDRGPDYNIYRGDNGTRIARVSPTAINYLEGDFYEPINGTIVSGSCEFDWCVRKGVYWADFKENSSSKDIVKFLYNGSYISYSPLDLRYVSGEDEEVIASVDKVIGKADGNEFVYGDIYGKGLDLGYEYHNSFLKENLVIESMDVLPSPSFDSDETYLSLDFSFDSKSFEKNDEVEEWTENEIFLSGKMIEENNFFERLLGSEENEVVKEDLEWNKIDKLKIKGEARFNKSDGGFGFRMPTPYAVDANGNFIELEYVFEIKNGETIVSVLTPYAWLIDEDRVYPVKVDPSVNSDPNDFSVLAYYTDPYYTKLENYDGLHTAGQISSGSIYRFLFMWDFSSSLRDKIGEASVDDIEVWFSVDSDDGSTPELYVAGNTDYYSTRSAETWYNYIYEGGSYGYDFGSNGYYGSDSDIEEMSTSSKNYHVHFTGNEGSGHVYVDDDAYLSFDYTCDVDSSCNSYCHLDNGVDCDCYSECTSGRCYGFSSGVYDCQSEGCADDGEYAPESDSCCESLSWNSGTEECYATVCGDGTKEGSEECDDDDTSNGDGCSSTCTVESGWSCSGEPSDCSENTNYCSGEINVFVEDSSGNPLEGVYAYLNGGSAYSTSPDGFKGFEITNENCDDSHSVQIKCSDQSTVCGSDSTRITYNGDIDSMYFVCDICSEDKDVLIDKQEVSFSEVGEDINLSVVVRSIGLTGSIDIMMSCGNQLFIEEVSLVSNGNVSANFVEDLSGCDKVDIWFEKVSGENDDSNNRIDGLFVIDVVKVKLNVETGYSLVDNKIESFIGEYAEIVQSSGSDVLDVYIGKSANISKFKSEGWLVNQIIQYKGKKEGVPYNGLIVKEGLNVYVFGNELDGTIASVRRLIEEKGEYLNERTLGDNREVYLSEEDIDAISVFDYLHTDENDEFYRKNSVDFANIVDNVLRRQTFNIAIKRVLTANDNTSLRLKNVNHEMSPEFREFTNERPVVLASGLWSNLFSWEELGQEIARGEGTSEYRDTWLAEITGGPNTECDSCPNYNFTDLTDFYWTALIGGVEAYTGESEIDYVGFSNGCRTALGSLEKWQASGKNNVGYYMNGSEWVEMGMSADVIHTFVGVGCPGSFEGSSYLTDRVNTNKDSVDKLENLGIMHPNMRDVAKKVSPLIGGIFIWEESNKISLGLWEDYNDAILNQTDSQFGNFNVNIAQIIYGYGGLNQIGNERDDGFVTATDAEAIFDNINASISKAGLGLKLRHNNLPDDKRVQAKIKEVLNR